MDAMEQHRWTQFLAAVRREIPSWESAATDAQSEIARLRARVERLEGAAEVMLNVVEVYASHRPTRAHANPCALCDAFFALRAALADAPADDETCSCDHQKGQGCTVCASRSFPCEQHRLLGCDLDRSPCESCVARAALADAESAQ